MRSAVARLPNSAMTADSDEIRGTLANFIDQAVRRQGLSEEVLLGAGSLVTPGQSLSAASLYRGRPARRVRGLEPRELEMLGYMSAHYVRLKDEYLVG